ncbi:lipid-binding SYLF domain-containing protein [Candidatus Electronema sp. JM]|uniref:lipid-binding SYLF domain-containing protein n=1 Tax=Candidatus Electronema sp. JM TaxID=3401571 RepID=UPI003AA8A8F6
MNAISLRNAALGLIALAAALLLPLSARRAAAGNLDEAQSLVLKSEAVFRSFMNDPGMVWFHENVGMARGILIVPQMLRGGFIIGGSGGSGVLLVRDDRHSASGWSYPAFYTIGSLSLGLQAGADASELVLLIMTERGLNAMLSTEIKAGADMSIAAGPLGRNAKAQTADVLAFGRAKGVFGGVSVEGAVIEPRTYWNSAYYGTAVSPIDILLRRTARNPQAEPLRSLMPGGRKKIQPALQQPVYPVPSDKNSGYPYPPPAEPLPPAPPESYYPASDTGNYASPLPPPNNKWREPEPDIPWGNGNPAQQQQPWRNPDGPQQRNMP